MRYLTRCLSPVLLAASAAVAMGGAPVTAANAAPARPATAATVVAPNSQTFAYNDTTQYFTVPAGVHQVHLVGSGGAGGAAGYRSGLFAAPGGLGADITLDAPVNPGDILVIEVGGQGGNATDQSAGVGANSSGTGENGGPGGNINSGIDGTAGGGGGGGTTVVDASNPGTPLLVAGGGGGGGGGGDVAGYNGGVGGNAGTTNNAGCDPGNGSGAYGSGLTGGAGGQCGQPANGVAGTSGSGETPATGAGTGGGGGGGYYAGSGGASGGSGGGGGGGGGAGASFWAPSTSNVQITNGDPGNGKVVVEWSTLPKVGIPQSAHFSCCTAKTFTVPAGVTQLSISGWGGSGGDGGAGGEGLVPARGGFGASISELVPVNPGDVLAVGSGGAGDHGEFVRDDATTVPVAGGTSSLNSSTQPGGYGGSITGGAHNAGGTGGAGGGGTVVTDQTTGGVLLDAGGGGGGGGASAAFTTGDGYNGGTGGNAGSARATGNPADGAGYYGSGGSTAGYSNGAGGSFASAVGSRGESAADETPGFDGGTGGGGGGGTSGGTAGQLCTGGSCRGSGGGGGAGGSGWPSFAQDVMVSNALGGVGGATISWVSQVATATAIAASANPAVAGTPVTFTATVSASGAPAGYAPTGTVTFVNSSTGLAYGLPVALSTSSPYTATLTTSLPAGTTQLLAYYSGDSNFLASSSAILSEGVNSALSASAVTPNVISQAASLPVTVTGSGFASGATLSASNAGITFSSVTVKNATTITAKEKAAAGVPVGSYDLRIQQGGLSTTCSGCLTVAAPPTVTSIAPASLAQGASGVLVKVAGTGFVSPAKVSFKGPSTGVQGTVTSTSATALTIKVRVPSTAARGAYTLKVTGGDGGAATCTGCLTVIQGPAVTAITPATATPGSKTTVTISGSGFSADAKLSGPKGVSFSGPSVNSSGTAIAATISVASSAPAGTGLAVTVTDGALGGYGSTTFKGLTIT